jgi:5-methyltetrahydropteroyltriglutamate--homocysteine methyltransferase
LRCHAENVRLDDGGGVSNINVIAGTDCGFATTADVLIVDPRIGWAKLVTMSEGARLASARLW